MTALIVVDHPEEWPHTFAAAEVISADAYLRDERFAGLRQARVYNLCDSYEYQTAGYYVSLLAAARGHRTMPGVATIQDMKSRSLLRADDELEEIVERSLHTIKSKRFELSIYFGCNLAERHADLEPRAVQSVSHAADAGDVREVIDDRAVAAAQHHADSGRRHSARPRRLPAPGHREPLRAARPGRARRRSVQYEHDLAILTNQDERSPPSNREALKRFERAARAERFRRRVPPNRDDYGRIAEFDALFIRETTAVNHHTYRFASRARAEGLVVIDDPESIIRCGNKVYLVELAKRLDLAIPPTMVVGSSTRTDEIDPRARPAVRAEAARQRVLAGRVPRRHARGARARGSSACCRAATSSSCSRSCRRSSTGASACSTGSRCSSAATSWPSGHWQIYHHGEKRTTEGESETIAVEHAPRDVSQLALRTANAIGDGFYGVDIKTVGGRHVLMEVNDNPNVDRGVEDAGPRRRALRSHHERAFRARVDAGKQFKPAA